MTTLFSLKRKNTFMNKVKKETRLVSKYRYYNSLLKFHLIESNSNKINLSVNNNWISDESMYDSVCKYNKKYMVILKRTGYIGICFFFNSYFKSVLYIKDNYPIYIEINCKLVYYLNNSKKDYFLIEDTLKKD